MLGMEFAKDLMSGGLKFTTQLQAHKFCGMHHCFLLGYWKQERFWNSDTMADDFSMIMARSY